MKELRRSLRFSRRIPALVVCAVAALLSSCDPPRSHNPLSDPKLAKADPRLTGMWRGKSPGDESEMVIHLIPKGGARVDIVLVGHDANGAHVLAFDAFPSKIGQETYLNLRPEAFATDFTDDVKTEPDYLFAKYELAPDGTLKFWVMSPDRVRDAIKAGTLKGSVNDKDNASISDDTAHLVRFVQADTKGQLFEPWATFTRVPEAKIRR